MDITTFLAPTSVLPRMDAHSKKQVLQALARHGAAITGIAERRIFDVLIERERLGSTGMGKGIALPHGRYDELDHVVGVFASMAVPVDFESPDNIPVDLVFMLLVPASCHSDHLKSLARVSRALRNPALCQAIRDTDEAAEIYTLLANASSEAA